MTELKYSNHLLNYLRDAPFFEKLAYVKDDGYYDSFSSIDAIHVLCAEIDRLHSWHRWIPVGEKLPEVGKLVYAAYKMGGKYYCCQCKMDKENKFRYTHHVKPITYWMPLPLPPESEDA